MEKRTEEKKPVRIPLLVRTVVNGYSVDLEREGYMFYSVQDLLEGLFVHVGLNRLEAMEKKDIKAMVEATKDGSLVKRLQAEVNELKATIDEQRKEIRSLKRKMKE